MLHILMGRARTGKSEAVLRAIRKAGDAGQQILLVPEHASHRAEIDVCRACGAGASRHAEVLTFKLLSSRVLSITGGLADVTLDNGGKLLTLQRTLQELAPVLTVYRRPSQRSAFLASLLAVLEELQAYAVSPEALAKSAEQIEGESGERLRAIALLYADYLARLHAPGRDARDRLEKLEEKLEESHYVDGKAVYLDGFSYFTGRECNILRILLRCAREVTVTLLGDESDPELFRESLRVRERLIRLAQDAGVRCDCRTLPPQEERSALDRIERGFISAQGVWEGDAPEVRLWEASSQYAECERVAAEILRLVREEGYRFREITVAARRLGDYLPVLETVFSRCGIPLYSSVRRNILEEPVLLLLLGALDAVSGGFEYEDVFRCLKSGLAGISDEECDLLENYALKWDIRGRMWVRDVPWSGHPDGYGAKLRESDSAVLEEINALRHRVCVPLSHLHEKIRGKSPAREKVTALYAFLEELSVPEQLQSETERLYSDGEGQRAEETAQLWGILCGVMDQFVGILGESELDAEEFARLFRLILTQYSVGTIPAALDEVNAVEITRNDRHPVRALFLLGANDGVLPCADGESGILKEEDRIALEEQNIRLAPYGMAQFHLELQNLYAALAQPTEKLFVSYPAANRSGEALRPSFIVGRIQTLCPSVKLEKETTDKEYRLTIKASALEAAGECVGGALWQYFSSDPACVPTLRRMEAASRYTRGRLSPEAVRSLYGDAITLSASQAEQAKRCHFGYFLRYGLRVKERRGASFDAPQSGTFVHQVMEQTLRAAEASGGLKSLSREALHALVRRAIDEYVAQQLPDLDEKNARFRYLFRRLCESMYRLMDDVADELSVSDFVPLKFELSFGTNGDLPAITLSEGTLSTRAVGKVDRVDGWLSDGKLYLRVIDYKTGKKKLDLSELRYGLGIQMLLYLYALEREGAQYFGAPIVPAGALYVPMREPIIKARRGDTQEKVARELQKELQRSGMVLSDPAVLRAMEHDALESPRYLPLKAKGGENGTIELGESVVSSAQLGKLGLYAAKVMQEITRELRSGNINADPVTVAQVPSCTYCEFASCCHFEDGAGGDHIEYVRATKAEELWKHVDEVTKKG